MEDYWDHKVKSETAKNPYWVKELSDYFQVRLKLPLGPGAIQTFTEGSKEYI